MPEKVIEFWAGSRPASLADVVSGATREISAPAGGGFGEALRELSVHLENLRTASEGQAEAVSDNTQALMANTAAQAASGRESAASKIGNAAKTIFGSGLGLSPLISGIVRLFGGERHEAPAPPALYERAAPISFEGAVVRSATHPALSPAPAEFGRWPEPAGEANASAASPVNVTVEVSAMDSRSFLDHSQEIARAVREAMLHSHSLNDVVSEL